MAYERADTIATVVNWFGPFTGVNSTDVLRNARRAAQEFSGTWHGLYTAIGAGESLRRGPRNMLYMGVGNPLETRLNPAHHKLGKLHLGALWLGEVAVHDLVGAQVKKLDIHADIAEWAHAFFLELPYNTQKRRNPPEHSCVVTNRWFATDYSTRVDRPHPRWPDIIDYDRRRRTAVLTRYDGPPRLSVMRLQDVVRRPPSRPTVFEE